MSTYDELSALQADHIRKTMGGSLFLAPLSATAFPAEPFAYTAAVTGPPAVPAKVEFVADIFEGYEDAGYLTDDGLSFENEITESNVTSWQAIEPTRSDITQDIDSFTVAMQETKLLTINAYTGASLTPDSRAASTGTVAFAKPARPGPSLWRGVAIGVDETPEGQVIVGRYYPRLKVTGRNGQTYNKGDDGLLWGVTFQAQVDATLGSSCRYFFGGLGWRARLVSMGFTAL